MVSAITHGIVPPQSLSPGHFCPYLSKLIHTILSIRHLPLNMRKLNINRTKHQKRNEQKSITNLHHWCHASGSTSSYVSLWHPIIYSPYSTIHLSIHRATTLWLANHHNMHNLAFNCLLTSLPSLLRGRKLPEDDRNWVLLVLVSPALHKVKTHDKKPGGWGNKCSHKTGPMMKG